MKEYRYNCFIEDVMSNVFDNVLNMSNINDRETYDYIYSMLEYYHNNIVVAKLANSDVEQKCYDSIENIHRIFSYSTKIDNIEFMLFCDCVNEINKCFNIHIQIDFDDYIDIECACMTFCNSDVIRRSRNRFSFYDFQYCYINVTEYIRQYEKHDVYYYSDRY